MTSRVLPCALLIGMLGFTVTAQAAGSLTRTFVSSAGNDANACTVTAPCRTFAAAYNATAANGIIAALDPAGYGSLNITGPVTIDGNGWAAITAPSGLGTAGITVNAGSSDKIVLRGLTIDGGASNSSGILFNFGGSLTVDGCVIRKMAAFGMIFSSAGGTAQTLAVSNSSFYASGSDGIEIATGGGGAITASIDHTSMDGNQQGLYVVGIGGLGALTVAVTDSVAANNGDYGFLIQSTNGQSVVNLLLTRVQSAGNLIGLGAAGANAIISLAQSTVSGNSGGGFAALPGGVINSFGDNYFANNGANAGSLTPVTKQ